MGYSFEMSHEFNKTGQGKLIQHATNNFVQDGITVQSKQFFGIIASDHIHIVTNC